jgi:hypothetical protein
MSIMGSPSVFLSATGTDRFHQTREASTVVSRAMTGLMFSPNSGSGPSPVSQRTQYGSACPNLISPGSGSRPRGTPDNSSSTYHTACSAYSATASPSKGTEPDPVPCAAPDPVRRHHRAQPDRPWCRAIQRRRRELRVPAHARNQLGAPHARRRLRLLHLPDPEPHVPVPLRRPCRQFPPASSGPPRTPATECSPDGRQKQLRRLPGIRKHRQRDT